jgi:hypothetical protein
MKEGEIQRDPAASSSADGAPNVDGAPPRPVGDHWIESPGTWTRVHVISRHPYFHPGDVEEGPEPDDLEPNRETFIKFKNGSSDVRLRNWQDVHWARAKVKLGWTGKTVFVEKGVLPSDEPRPEPEQVTTVLPGFAGMRGELARAQRKDPGLLEVIQSLRKAPMGSYLVDPRGPGGRRVKS